MRHWIIPNLLWEHSLEELGRDGRHGCEGICLWLTSLAAETPLEFVRAAVLRGPLVRRTPFSIQIDSQLMSELTDELDAQGLMLAGQVHGHPGRFLDLSDVDRALGFRVPEFLSAVAPHYGTRPDTPLQQCGFHEFVPSVGYRMLTSADLAARISTSETRVAPPLVIGEDRG
jgi:hypothetical protein